VGLFGRKASRGPLPSDIVGKLELFGKHEWAVPFSPYDSSEIWNTVLQPLITPAQSSPAEMIDALAANVSPHGGWAAYGAERLMYELVSDPQQYPSYPTVMDASLSFLRQNNVPPMRVSGHEWNYWIDSGGSVEGWIPPLPVPSRAATSIRDLTPGEVRKVAQLSSQPDSNLIYVTSDAGSGDFIALIDSKWSDEDPTRSRSEWKRSQSLFDLYLDIGYELQSVHWSDPELQQFFPIPPCTLPMV
jgi:hypothetical protein